MILRKISLPRRTILRGIGSAIALPLLEAMVPAATALSRTAADPPRRFGCIYVPNGMAMEYWAPSTEGSGFDMSPVLKPLEPFRQRLNLVSGLKGVIGVGGHASASTGFLTGVGGRSTYKETLAATSLDQIIARELEEETQLGSLELGLDGAVSGSCDGQVSCTMTNTVSWRSPTTPLPMEINPRAVFERMFGNDPTTDPKLRLARLERDRSIIDSVRGAVADLQRTVGGGDRAKIDQYLEAIRDIERRIQIVERHNNFELPVMERPAGVPESYREHARLMFDLHRLAYQADLTRVVTFMLGRELSGRSYPELGISEGHHLLSHHADRAEQIAKMSRLNTYHVSLFAEFVEKLDSTPDGAGTMLDHVLLLYGAGMSNSNSHLRDNLPLMLVGGGSGQFRKFDRHLVFKGRAATSLHLTILDKLRNCSRGVPEFRRQNCYGTFGRHLKD